MLAGAGVGIILVVDKFNVPAPGANTNILSANVTPKMGGAFRVTVLLATTSVFNVMIKNGSTTFTASLNNGVALTGGNLYTFAFGVSTLQSYNFQVATNGVIQVLQVDEISQGVI